MVRVNVDKSAVSESDYKMPDDLKSEKKKKSKKMKLKTKFLIFFFVVIVSFLIGITIAVARSGVFNIPVVSSIFYRIPEPSRMVSSDNFVGDANFDSNSKILKMEISESDLNAALKKSLVGKQDSYFGDNFQVLILDEDLEIFGYLLQPIKANITFRVKPYIKDEKLEVEVTQAKVGTTKIPTFVADWLVHKIIDEKLNEVNEDANKIKFISLELTEQKLSFSLYADAGLILKSLLEKANLQ